MRNAVPIAAAPTGGTAPVGDGQTVGLRIHRDMAQIERVWRRYESSGYLTVFQRFDWASILLREVVAKRKAEFFVAELVGEGGEPLMLLPLAIEESRGLKRLCVLDFETSDYTAPLLASSRPIPASLVIRFWNELRRAIPHVDTVEMPRLPARIRDAENPMLHLPGCKVSEWGQFGLPLTGPAEDLIERSTRPSTFKDYSKLRRRLEKQGTPVLRVASTEQEVHAMFDTLLEQRRGRFHEMGRYNLLDKPQAAAFYRECAIAGLSGGPARLFGLVVNDKIVATAFGALHDGRFALLIQTMTGEPEWRRCSPGILITAKTMEWAVENGQDYYDFTYSFQPYKEELGACRSDLFEIIEPLSIRAKLILHGAAMSERARMGLITQLRRQPRVYEVLRSYRRRMHRALTKRKTS